MLTFVDVNFHLDSACLSQRLEDKGRFRSANIFQIADVVRRVVLLLFLLCFKTVVSNETSKMFRLFLLTTKTIQTRYQVFSSSVQFGKILVNLVDNSWL